MNSTHRFNIHIHQNGEENEVTQVVYEYEELQAIYQKSIEEPNKCITKKGFIKCPECGEEILMIPTLRVMHEAIERHISKHKEVLRENPIREHQTAISIRLSLTGQVLQYACKPQVS
jgi:hypothetical protein